MASAATVPPKDTPLTLSQYLFPPHFACALGAIDEQLQPHETDTEDRWWRDPVLHVDQHLLGDLRQWTKSYHSSDIAICYSRLEDVNIRPPTQVVVAADTGKPIRCFFKQFEISFGPKHAKGELMTHKKILMASCPEALICQLHGVVQDGNGLTGMLFPWIEKKSVLSRAKATQSSMILRQKWANQIRRSFETLHKHAIIWGDVKAENVLIDTDDNAWLVDFGGATRLDG